MRGLLVLGAGSLAGRLLFLLLEENLIIGFGNNVQQAVHLVMSQAAQLRAHDLVLADFAGAEMNGDDHARNGVLLEAQLANEEIVDDVLRTDEQLDLAIHRDSESGDDDVVFSGWI